jgi:hypothetical protein
MATPELEIDFIDQHFAALMNRLAEGSFAGIGVGGKTGQ